MSYTKFIEKLKTLGYDIPTEDGGRYSIRYASGPVLYQKNLCLVNSWHVGGSRGASCWDDAKPTPYTTGDPEPEWTVLDKLLETFCPGITFLQYKQLMAKAKSDSEGDTDYYGNESVYSVRILKLEDLYEFLSERNYLNEDV